MVTGQLVVALALTTHAIVNSIVVLNSFKKNQFRIYRFNSSNSYMVSEPPRAWFERLTKTLVQFGFKSSRCDPSLFIHILTGHSTYVFFSDKRHSTYVLVYVDDIIVNRSSPRCISALISKLYSAFALKPLGDLDYFLGVEVKRLPNGGLILSQSKYIEDLLAKAHMAKPKSLPTPMVSRCKLTKVGGNYMADPSHYRSIVGALQCDYNTA